MGTSKFVLAAFAAAFLLTPGAVFAGSDIEGGTEYKIAQGGQLYDNWIEITEAADPPMGTNEAYPQDKGKARKAKSWLCISCHGWDYKGKDGVFGKEGDKDFTGIKGVIGAAGKDPKSLLDVIKGKHGLKDDSIEDEEVEALAAFVSAGLGDVGKYISATGQGTGDKAKGKLYYSTLCINCHGADGKLIADLPALGALTNENPWRGLHTIRNGRPKQPMPGLRALPENVSGDILAYVQTLSK
ncbi:MAG: hypothetical protein A3G18_12095 [Rhodospirillales bacterium RIFCSPLOWO2_12_FULL_58_28]|nr:MAG: hypothetical protein A3H92_09180 [Rhodospirillales bacterium RIFCSPLOWO2_02_FULL_58_16]OHC78179.1 MAG: hypothetical protein A3G18_12095 [Rhodospirillales bacterium RIFCSPLOWO2_12_FULL_58_28]